MGPVTRSFQAQVLWTACEQGYHLTLSLKSARHGAHALGACQNHTHFGPQIAPSRGSDLQVSFSFGLDIFYCLIPFLLGGGNDRWRSTFLLGC